MPTPPCVMGSIAKDLDAAEQGDDGDQRADDEVGPVRSRPYDQAAREEDATI
jgi:hypothetical protein